MSEGPAPAYGTGGQKVRAALAAYIAQKGLKGTRQRDLIVEAFFAARRHVTVEELLERVRQQDPRVGAATVYRTMKLLVESGLASARQFGEGQARYEMAGDRHHDHLICTRCGTIVEFENDRIEAMQEVVARRHGFSVTHHKMELYGLCRNCQRHGDRKV